jgi:acetoin utilization protein AcuB
MLVRDVMHSNVITVAPDTTVTEAAQLMSHHGIRHLPIVSETRLVGLISERDLKASAASRATTRTGRGPVPAVEPTVADLLRPVLLSVTSLTPAEDAARLLARHRIGSLPVVDGGQLVGIVTDTDLLAFLARTIASEESSVRIDVVLPSPQASLEKIVRAVEEVGFRLASVIVPPVLEGPTMAVIRIESSQKLRCQSAIAALRNAGYPARVVSTH